MPPSVVNVSVNSGSRFVVFLKKVNKISVDTINDQQSG